VAGLFSDRHNSPYGRTGILYPLADDFCEVGFSVLDFRRRSFAFWSFSNQNDLGLLSPEREKGWHLSFNLLS